MRLSCEKLCLAPKSALWLFFWCTLWVATKFLLGIPRQSFFSTPYYLSDKPTIFFRSGGFMTSLNLACKPLKGAHLWSEKSLRLMPFSKSSRLSCEMNYCSWHSQRSHGIFPQILTTFSVKGSGVRHCKKHENHLVLQNTKLIHALEVPDVHSLKCI